VVENSGSAKIAILGAGSWGATLAWLLASHGRQVALWSHDSEKAARLRETRQLEKPLQISIPANVEISDNLDECVQDAGIILFCCTAQSMGTVAAQVQKALTAKVSAGRSQTESSSAAKPVLVSAAKGIELKTFRRMSEVLTDVVPGHAVCALSGPNLAAEVLRGLPTATVVACTDEQVARLVQHELSTRTFRIYTNSDLVGVELAGALKNVIAIAAGAVDGLDLGTNAKAALMSRGLAEMTRLSVAVGARGSTLSGLAGMGDLVATCYSSLSRNYRMGYRMARGDSAQAAAKELGAIAEGVTTATAVCEFSRKLGIQLPIAEQVEATLRGDSTPEKAIMTLMARPLASE
jgi:glycerol-3-phosphate dehydrogenase (NAD(P)+)